ncbi:ribose transport system substrate-binding protein [Sinosporangium album]|uniref:Ribose transport system substrate-binding protein n=1 Tax=Sinosporangium album TaxID=504805 RepID=A0A1G7Z0Z7_9ACTN|nr:sugar ABC transporter substrate-binding protein [Sinosporangium album]SDH01820.1 ribose transport system substrate-binding protein [Sinosporangium album]
MPMRRSRATMSAAALLLAAAPLLTAACADAGYGDEAQETATNRRLRIAFFGFAKSSSVASAAFAGVQDYAKAVNATAEFIDPNFDPQTQLHQIQDAIASKHFNVFIVQANDGTTILPGIRSAVQAGITVVIQHAPVGPRYDTAKPQVDGTITLVDVPTHNGTTLASLAIDACQTEKLAPCNVAYLSGLSTSPADKARTKAAANKLKTADNVRLVAQLEGGHTTDSGRKAMQELLRREPNVHVVIGSPQAITGAETTAKNKKILYIANGASRQTVRAVQQDRWHAAYYLPIRTLGARAAELGLAKARGKKVPTATDMTDHRPDRSMGTKGVLSDVTGEYDDE